MRDYAASIRDRLSALARERGKEFQQLLIRYVGERFLYRLSVSEHRDRCVLKGGSLIGLWMAEPYRATRDLDLLAYGPSDAGSVRELIALICAQPCPEDGLNFDLASLRVDDIRDQDEYGGKRARIDAMLGKAVIHLQIDLGFGDAVEPVDEEYPALLEGLPRPFLRVYPREYVIAEKFAAMVSLGRRTSRMKDFHDIWVLSRDFKFELPVLAKAVAGCLERRAIGIANEKPDALQSAFYEDENLQSRWRAYRTKGVFASSPPAAFPEVGAALGDFLSPLYDAIISNAMPRTRWLPGGPWM